MYRRRQLLHRTLWVEERSAEELRATVRHAAMFVGAEKSEIKVTLNDNFDLTSMSAEEIRYLIDLYYKNGIAFSEFRENLRRSGIAKLGDDEAKAEITADMALKQQLMPVDDSNPNPSESYSNGA
jgi:hypothetical protein